MTPLIQSDDFHKALHRYIDENKPDPLIKKQMESWILEWNELKDSTLKKDETSHSIQGTLEWKDSKVKLQLQTACTWRGVNKKDGKITFSCKARIHFRDTPDKMEQKVIERMKEDSYVKHLLKERTIMEADIQSDEKKLVEVVHTNEKAAEAIRRTIFSTAEDSMDVYDFMLALPFLPCIFHSYLNVTTALADRVRLRILEDVTFDACEEEEEQEMVQELHISKKTKR